MFLDTFYGPAGLPRLGRALCLAGASLGALGVIAWLLGMERFLTVIPGLPPMMPNSAFALLLLGVSGASVLQERSGHLQRLLVTFAAIVVLAISLGTAAEYTLDTHLFLDQLVGNRVGPYYPRRSSPPAAIAIALLAAGVLFSDLGSGKRFRPSEWLVLCTALIAVTALLGYLYGTSPRYRLTGAPTIGITPTSMRLIRVAADLLIIGVSFPTAVSLLLISTGLFLRRPDWGTMRIVAGPGPGGLMLRRLTPVAILVPIGSGVIASRLPGIGDAPLALSGLTDVTVTLSLFLLSTTALRLDRGHDALEYARTRARELIDLASDGILICDLDGRLTEVNEAGCCLHGYSREEMLTKNIIDLVALEDKERIWVHRDRLLEGHTDIREWTVIRKDGARFPVEVSAKILPDGRWQGIVRDISERKRVEEELRRSESEQRILAELGAAVAGTMEFDERLTVIAQLFSRDVADLCIIDLLDNGSFRRARVVCRDVSKEWLCDVLMRLPLDVEQIRIDVPELSSGKLIFMQKLTPDVIGSWARGPKERAALQNAQSAIVSPLLARGKLLGVVSLLSFSRVFDEKDLRIVEEVNQEAALLLDNARRFGAAKQATQARDDMLGVVAHDLRNPLAAIATLGAVLKRGPEHELGDEIETASSRMSRLIQDLVDVTRLEVGPLPLERAALSSDEVLSAALASQAPLASTASLKISLDAAPDLPDVWADRDRLLQVFENLIGNAIKFTKPGGHIAVAAKAGTNEVLFSVADTGCGIDSKQLPHVFDRFWQAPKAKRGGVGLGLPIVKGIVETHGGRVWVQSSPGRGSTFLFTIPTRVKASNPNR